jgi:hypothetical protein
MKRWVEASTGLFLFALCTASFAAVQEVTCTASLAPTELNVDLACAQFHGPVQALTSISIELRGQISGTMSLTNNTQGTLTATATTLTDFNLASIAGFGPTDPANSGFSWTNPLFSASFDTGPLSLAAGESKVVTGSSQVESATLALNTTQFQPYTGAGTFNLHVDTLTGLENVSAFPTGGHGSPIIPGQEISATVTALIQYSVVPEPAAVSLVAVGLLGLLWLNRSRRS